MGGNRIAIPASVPREESNTIKTITVCGHVILRRGFEWEWLRIIIGSFRGRLIRVVYTWEYL